MGRYASRSDTFGFGFEYFWFWRLYRHPPPPLYWRGDKGVRRSDEYNLKD